MVPYLVNIFSLQERGGGRMIQPHSLGQSDYGKKKEVSLTKGRIEASSIQSTVLQYMLGSFDERRL